MATVRAQYAAVAVLQPPVEPVQVGRRVPLHSQDIASFCLKRERVDIGRVRDLTADQLIVVDGNRLFLRHCRTAQQSDEQSDLPHVITPQGGDAYTAVMRFFPWLWLALRTPASHDPAP